MCLAGQDVFDKDYSLRCETFSFWNNLANVCFQCVLFLGVSRGRKQRGNDSFQQCKKLIPIKHWLVSWLGDRKSSKHLVEADRSKLDPTHGTALHPLGSMKRGFPITPVRRDTFHGEGTLLAVLMEECQTASCGGKSRNGRVLVGATLLCVSIKQEQKSFYSIY